MQSQCPDGEMVDALVSGASAERRVGSSPILGTSKGVFVRRLLFHLPGIGLGQLVAVWQCRLRVIGVVALLCNYKHCADSLKAIKFSFRLSSQLLQLCCTTTPFPSCTAQTCGNRSSPDSGSVCSRLCRRSSLCVVVIRVLHLPGIGLGQLVAVWQSPTYLLARRFPHSLRSLGMTITIFRPPALIAAQFFFQKKVVGATTAYY